MKLEKVVIPVAGLGTRMLPATKAIPKEMLPLVDKPLIQYVVNECIAAGIKQIVLVTHSSKNSIENHFDKSFELESILEKRVKRQLLDDVQRICPKDVTIMHVRQGEAKGLGHAVLCALPVVGQEPFAVVLPDVLIDEYEGKVPDDLDELLKLKGVGRKTANLTITLGYNKPGICVDIHVHRITNRWGYVSTKDPEETEFALRDKLPKEYWLDINDLLVCYGQNLCKPISPFCSQCKIKQFCDQIDVGKSR
ncbi:MAG: sugar phosphate nucleotidyltransferase [Candidatus Sericytochromatia bacterium]